MKSLNKIDDTDIILDIGENTLKKIYDVINESKTILWNGPAGYFELKKFSEGSNKIAKKIQTIVIVGAMANNFIKNKGYKIGKSL